MKKLRKSTWITAAIFIYTTAASAYFLPRNHEIGTWEKYLTVAASYAIILLLWFVLRKKEELRKKHQ